MHGGVDLCCWSGTLNKNVISTAAGTVIYSGFNGYGNCVMIDHGNGIVSLYGHLNSRKVAVGDVVSQGQLIGLAGSTYGPGGYSTGPHLHFEIRVNDSRENPRTYVDLPAYSDW
jgi:murein DD-endopeptidase MepM/ murein hydrolase activator NlpD